MERLDSVFANDELINLFPEAIVTHLPKMHSDHNLLLIEITPKKNCTLRKSFKLETFWFRRPDFINLVKDSWQNSN